MYATFASYDEVAHHSGLERADTMEALRKLDQQFGRIERARRYAPRPYEIVVLSDHGQTQGATFKQRNGYGLDDLVERSLAARRGRRLRGRRRAERDGRARRQRGDRAQARTKRPKNDVSDRNVVVLGSGNLGLVYLMEEKRRLTLEEIDERHPELIPALREHPHVGWLLVRSAEHGPVALGAGGAHYLADGRIEGEDPLAPFSPNAPRHLLRTDGFAHVADIMVGSFYDPELDEGCAFEELISFHGGLGGPQTRPFILYPEQPAAAGASRSSAPPRSTACSRAGGGCSTGLRAPPDTDAGVELRRGAEGGGDLVDRRPLGVAHLLAALLVGPCDTLGHGEHEAPVVLDLLGARLLLQQLDRVTQVLKGVLPDLLGRVVATTVDLGLGEAMSSSKLARPRAAAWPPCRPSQSRSSRGTCRRGKPSPPPCRRWAAPPRAAPTPPR